MFARRLPRGTRTGTGVKCLSGRVMVHRSPEHRQAHGGLDFAGCLIRTRYGGYRVRWSKGRARAAGPAESRSGGLVNAPGELPYEDEIRSVEGPDALRGGAEGTAPDPTPRQQQSLVREPRYRNSLSTRARTLCATSSAAVTRSIACLDEFIRSSTAFSNRMDLRSSRYRLGSLGAEFLPPDATAWRSTGSSRTAICAPRVSSRSLETFRSAAPSPCCPGNSSWRPRRRLRVYPA